MLPVVFSTLTITNDLLSLFKSNKLPKEHKMTTVETPATITSNMLVKNSSWIEFAEKLSSKVVSEEYKRKGFNVKHRKFSRDKAEKLVSMLETFSTIDPQNDPQDARGLIHGILFEYFAIPMARMLDKNGKLHVGFFRTYLQSESQGHA